MTGSPPGKEPQTSPEQAAHDQPTSPTGTQHRALRSVVLSDLGLAPNAVDEDLQRAVFQRLSGESPASRRADATLIAATSLLANRPIPEAISDELLNRYADRLVAEFCNCYFELAPPQRRARYEEVLVECEAAPVAVRRLEPLKSGLYFPTASPEALSTTQRSFTESLKQIFVSTPSEKVRLRRMLLKCGNQATRLSFQDINQIRLRYPGILLLDRHLVMSVWLLAPGNQEIAEAVEKQNQQIHQLALRTKRQETWRYLCRLWGSCLAVLVCLLIATRYFDSPRNSWRNDSQSQRSNDSTRNRSFYEYQRDYQELMLINHLAQLANGKPEYLNARLKDIYPVFVEAFHHPKERKREEARRLAAELVQRVRKYQQEGFTFTKESLDAISELSEALSNYPKSDPVNAPREADDSAREEPSETVM